MNISVDKYLSPVSGNKTTIVLPLFSLLWASFIAAAKAAPDDIPINNPSKWAEALPFSNASSLEIGKISS